LNAGHRPWAGKNKQSKNLNQKKGMVYIMHLKKGVLAFAEAIKKEADT